MAPAMAPSKSTKAWNWNGTRKVINLERYVPALLTAISTGLARGPSRRHLKKFRLGIIEWRVVAALAVSGGITASRICEMIGLDKAAASRSLRVLKKLKFVSCAGDPKDQRRRYNLTRSGYRFHDRIFPIAMERERLMLQRLSSQEINMLIDLLRRVGEQMPSVKAYPAERRSPQAGTLHKA